MIAALVASSLVVVFAAASEVMTWFLGSCPCCASSAVTLCGKDLSRLRHLSVCGDHKRGIPRVCPRVAIASLDPFLSHGWKPACLSGVGCSFTCMVSHVVGHLLQWCVHRCTIDSFVLFINRKAESSIACLGGSLACTWWTMNTVKACLVHVRANTDNCL